MDYEKKYKQLYNFISDLYPFMSEYCKEKVEGFLPELKESDDERISKEIIKYLEQTVPHHHRDEVLKSKEWTAWLEKQGEKKISYTTLVETGNGGINALVTRELPIDSCDNEQKPDWSNKEKLMLNDIIEATERSNIFMEDYQRELVDWLKSLRPQPKQE